MNTREKEVTKIIQGDEKVLEVVSKFISNAITRIDACIDQTRASLGSDIGQIKALILNSRNRGVRIRFITEIITDNVYCKQLLEIVDELRHLDNIVGTFYVSDKEYLVPESVHKRSKPASQIIYWNVKDTVKHHQQYVFETPWYKAISAQQKINQIERGELPEVIEITHDKRSSTIGTKACECC